jgi:type IV secretion system protein VirB4
MMFIREVVEATKEQVLIDGYAETFANDKFVSYFNMHEDNLSIIEANHIISIDVSGMVSNPRLFCSYIGLLIKKLKKVLDGEKTIIAIPKISGLYEIKSFYPLFNAWLADINKSNAIAFLSSSQDEDIRENQVFLKDINSFATKIFMSDKFADKYFMRAFKLNENELYKIKSYDPSRRMFLFKQDNTSIVLSLNLQSLGDQLKILEAKDA